MFHRFNCEADFYPDLSRLPLYVRMKLDVTGIKLSLKDWLAFSMEERQVLCHLPVASDEEKNIFTAYLHFLCRRYRGAPTETVPSMDAALWSDNRRVPDPVLEKSGATGKRLTLDEWNRCRFHERYALYKTAVSKSEPEKFYAVLAELFPGLE